MRHFFCDSLKRFFVACALTVVGIFSATAATLPTGYTELEYVDMQSGSYLGVSGQSITSGYKIEFDFATTNITNALSNYFGARASGVSAGGGFRVTKLQNQGVALYGFDTTDAYESGANIMAANTRYKYVYENGTCTLSSGGTDVLTHAYTINDNSTITAFGINAYTANGTSYAASPVGIYFYGLKIWNAQGQLIADYVPAKYGNSVGIYDTVSNTFKTATSGTFAAGPMACPGGTVETHHEFGLPVGYTLLESITGYANQSVINSGVAGNNDNLRIVIRASKDTSQGYTPLFANYIDEASNVTRVIAGSSVGQVIFDMNRQSGNSDNINGVKFTDVHTYELYKTSDGISTLKVDGEVAGTSVNRQGTANSTNIALGSSKVLAAQPSSLASTYWYFYFCKIYDDGVLIRDYVPVKRDSDNVVGVYDLVNNTFDPGQYPNFAPFTAGSTVSDPIVEQCVAGTGIKIATTKYTEDAFAGLMTTLSEAITKVTNIVDTTVQQATEIGNLATTKQDRPDTDCPAGRKCLLIMGADNKPHWYLIQE